MIIDHRTYTVQHGRAKEYIQLMETKGMAIQKRHLVLVGYYQTAVGPLNEFVHLWRYDDLADMERRRAARDADPDWAEFLKKTKGIMVKQENKLIKPLSFSPDA
ncbi:MAG: NIPSNAP family protein [Rhodospirillaceae bacterium]